MMIRLFEQHLKLFFGFLMNAFSSRNNLQLDNVKIRGKKGSLHFIRFPTSEMCTFLELAKSKGSKCLSLSLNGNLWRFYSEYFFTLKPFPVVVTVARLLTTVCATGGGAFKFEEEFKRVSFF